MACLTLTLMLITADPGHRRFDILGSVGPRCNDFESFGKGDGEKRACGLTKLMSPCRIFSIGSSQVWDFEAEIVERTPCHVDTFDCTGDPQLMPPAQLRSRVKLHHVCIGASNVTRYSDNHPRVFLDWQSMLNLVKLDKPPDFLKMDVEGFEYDVIRSILRNSPPELLPTQIGFELHYKTQMTELSWYGREISAAEMALFMDHLTRVGGYSLIDRHDNPYCPHCSELLVSRVHQNISRLTKSRSPGAHGQLHKTSRPMEDILGFAKHAVGA